MVCFEAYLLCSYNLQIGKIVLMNCKCYNIYREESTFIESVINLRQSYMACICYESQKRKRVGHKTVPIMLGSYLDYRIRGAQAVERSRAQWGAVILRGMLKIYTSFSTFDALSMHVRQTHEAKSIEWFTYIGNEGVALKYSNKVVEWTYRYETQNNLSSNAWIELINQANPFIKRRILATEYIQMFDDVLKYPYDMNDLKNRQFINGVSIMRKYIDYELAKRDKKKGVGCMKMAHAFETGALYIVLSKKNTYETEEWCKNYPQNYDNTLHEGRSNKTVHFLQNVTRASNDAVRNSKALTFPSDAFGFLCLLNTKDLKSAGEQNVLADFVIMTEESDPTELYEYLRRVTSEQSSITAGRSTEHHLIINGFITDCRKDWTFEDFKRLKRTLRHVTLKFYQPYIIFSTKASIPIKYSHEHDIYVSPAEVGEYNVTFPESSMISVTAKELVPVGITKTPASKSTVAINNIKGSVANLTSNFHKSLMRMSLGTTCYMENNTEIISALADSAVISRDNDTRHFQQAFSQLEKTFGLTTCYATSQQHDPIVGGAMRSFLKMYVLDDLLIENKGSHGTPYVRERNTESSPLVSSYMTMLLGPKNYPPPSVWNLRLWAMFGNSNGACVEDGVVLDRKTVDAMPKIYYNACITVDFTLKTTRQARSPVFVAVDDKDECARDETLVGCLISEHEALVKNSKHCKIVFGKIGNHYYYLLHFLPKQNNTYAGLQVRHVLHGKVITVIITGVHETRVCVGTKVANSFGQKNVCSKLADLSGYWGITRDGRKVHAQIMYSVVSIVGRVASGQLYCMLTSPDLAIGPNKEILAPVDLVIHALHPYTNIKIFDVKVDTLTNINGFDSQVLVNTSLALRSKRIFGKVLQVIGLHGYSVTVDSTHFARR
ncbi:lef-8 [Venturia canescens]|uniref:Lef-8 n=2 Tax=Venturia canescens TaxID=32260 RepID=A0ACB9ZIY5_9HYME|nr:lef-8 [Venturia canescens]